MERALPVVTANGETEYISEIDIDGTMYSVGVNTTLSQLFYSVIHAGTGRGKVWYSNPAVFFELNYTQDKDDVSPQEQTEIDRHKREFLEGAVVADWRARAAAIRGDPTAHIEAARSRADAR